MNLDKHDVERIVETMLSEFSMVVKPGDFTDPNCRTIILKYKGIEVTRTYFDVVQKDEYEG